MRSGNDGTEKSRAGIDSDEVSKTGEPEIVADSFGAIHTISGTFLLHPNKDAISRTATPVLLLGIHRLEGGIAKVVRSIWGHSNFEDDREALSFGNFLNRRSGSFDTT